MSTPPSSPAPASAPDPAPAPPPTPAPAPADPPAPTSPGPGGWKGAALATGRALHKAMVWDGWLKAAALATAATAIAAVLFTGKSLRATENQYGLTQRTWFTDRFTKATEQLGSDKLNVRLGGIYSLEWLARDSSSPGQASNQSMIFEVVSAFVRTHRATPLPVLGPCEVSGIVDLDVQAALTVIGRRNTGQDGPDPINLADSHLRYASMRSAHMRGAVLSGADLTCG
ncbi:pentapeptide repeat-containing protein, partial [Nocardia sp. NPDC058518]|uniref:pentapeptide repeat-containing protein n=1 Tax=Nocardia sp. NPDC058518 TaxID=3346534 RepID=UPI00365CECE0